MNPYGYPCSFLHATLLLLVCSSFITRHRPLAAASLISSNQSLSGSQTITSEGGNFVLGFFSPGRSQNSYLGIWFKKVSKQTVVWVANREAPLSAPSSSELKISDDGNLVILSSLSKTPIWTTNSTSITSNSPVAELLDTGNLVLRDGSNSSSVFWQSFDHPTNTWLPGSKLGLNKVTGKNQLLTSWKSSEDPAPGAYSLELDPDGTSQYIIQWNRSKTYWTSGNWNGQIFSLVPEMTSNYIYTFDYISNDTESYFIYYLKNNSIITRFVMDLSGQIKQFTWLEETQQWFLFWSQPRAQCDVHSLCGPFSSCNEKSLPYCGCLKGFREAFPENWDLDDLSGGCARNTPLQCEDSASAANGDLDRSFEMPIKKPPENPQAVIVGSAEECASACLSNCSCTAYSYEGACSLWHGGLINLQQLSDGTGETLYLRLAASELPSSKSKKGTTIGTAVGVGLGILVLSAVVWVLIWMHRRKKYSKLKVVEGTLIPFRYDDLRRVTKNFSEKLGGGGFGSVFKGRLPDSTEVAVKSLEGIGQGEKQFRSEVSTIGTIQHVNLVRLLGFCSEGKKRLLVYDYMPKGSLDAVLLRDNSPVLDWQTRYQIALGTARGLAYLHEKCRDCIIHCDIKPENILLDNSYVAKVADFGLAKLIGRDFSRVLTTMRGTRGYLAPEWIWGVAITAKADVYSYGMMLFEIVSGRRNSEKGSEGAMSGFFPAQAATKLVEGEVMSIIDPRLVDDASSEEVERVCRVACWCIQEDEMSRPTMGQIVQILEGVLDVNMPPMPRILQNLSESPANVDFFTDASGHGSQVPSSISTGSHNRSITSSSSGN